MTSKTTEDVAAATGGALEELAGDELVHVVVPRPGAPGIYDSRAAFASAFGTGGVPAQLGVVRPEQFGAVQIDPLNPDAGDDSTAELQAFLDAAFDSANSGKTFDFSGHWKISAPLYAGLALNYNVVAGHFVNDTSHKRRFIAGKLYVAPVAAQPGGVAMDTVLTIMGHVHVTGDLMIHDGGEGRPYATRRFVNGVSLIQTGESYIESIEIYGAKRWGVINDSTGTAWSVRDGTPYQTGSGSRNSIGLRIGRIYCVSCGSCQQIPGNNVTKAAVYTQGKDVAGAFSNVPGGGEFNGSQQTRIAIDDTSDEAAFDYVRARVERVAAEFGTLAFDSVASTITCSLGDPIAMGFAVGAFINVLGAGKLNHNRWYEILGFSGASNRTIKVKHGGTSSAIADEAATAYTGINTSWQLAQVMRKDATNAYAFPWLVDGTNSQAGFIFGGAFQHKGVDGTACNVGYLGAFKCSIGLWSLALYGPRIDTMMTDYVDIGILFGQQAGSSNIGTSIGYRHIEAAMWPIIQNEQSLFSAFIGDGPTLGDLGSCFKLRYKSATSAWLMVSPELTGLTLIDAGRIYGAKALGANGVYASGAMTLICAPGYENRVLEHDAPTVTLELDDYSLRFSNDATYRLTHTGAGGGRPTSCTFQLSDGLTQRGWTLVGGPVFKANMPATLFSITFDKASKKAIVQRIGSREEWAPQFTAAGDLYIPANEAMIISQGNAKIGAGGLTFKKSTAASPGVFAATVLPVALEAGAWLQVTADGACATHLVRTA